MDFIERWLGLTPDGGSGAVELAVLMTCAGVALAAVALWRLRHAGFPGLTLAVRRARRSTRP